jgi:malate dehydrogenase (oxaloacetate-decarboxylating)(NADP+)
MLVGLTHSVQICQLGAKDSDIVNLAALAAYDING